jgi:hypothetical protein
MAMATAIGKENRRIMEDGWTGMDISILKLISQAFSSQVSRMTLAVVCPKASIKPGRMATSDTPGMDKGGNK